MADLTRFTIGERLKERRTKEGLSLRKMSKRLEISDSFLFEIEKGTRKPSQKKFLQFVILLKEENLPLGGN